MTILEKFMEEYPKANPEAVVLLMCPEDFGLKKETGPCEAIDRMDESACRECWGREYQEGGAEERAAEGVGPYSAEEGGGNGA